MSCKSNWVNACDKQQFPGWKSWRSIYPNLLHLPQPLPLLPGVNCPLPSLPVLVCVCVCVCVCVHAHVRCARDRAERSPPAAPNPAISLPSYAQPRHLHAARSQPLLSQYPALQALYFVPSCNLDLCFGLLSLLCSPAPDHLDLLPSSAPWTPLWIQPPRLLPPQNSPPPWTLPVRIWASDPTLLQ